MKFQKYDPNTVSEPVKWVFTVIAAALAPFTLLISLVFINYIWEGRLPFTKNDSGQITKKSKATKIVGGIIVSYLILCLLVTVIAMTMMGTPQ